MTRKVSAVGFGSTLLIGAVVLAVVGYQSVMGVNSAILQAVLKAPKASGYDQLLICLLYTSPSPRDVEESRMPSSA